MFKGIFSKPYSRLFIVGDNTGWVTDIEAQNLKSICQKLNIKSDIIKKMYWGLPQAVHYTSQFSILLDIWKNGNKISLDYFHGKPEQGENFKKCFEALEKHQDQIARIRVSTKEMEQRIIEVVGKDKVMRIPIGVDLDVFKNRSSKLETRSSLGIPDNAVVIGSFQKDGSGWGEGNEPKLIKGPDIFIKVIENLKSEIDDLFVLLSGPSRGFVKKELEKLGVPYKHLNHKDYREVAKLYDALDLYLITSREEGGPKAVLESMAKGIPLVTTEVGQARDLVIDRKNAMITPIEDVAKLTKVSIEILSDPELKNAVIQGGLITAQENSLESQIPLWKEYLKPLISG